MINIREAQEFFNKLDDTIRLAERSETMFKAIQIENAKLKNENAGLLIDIRSDEKNTDSLLKEIDELKFKLKESKGRMKSISLFVGERSNLEGEDATRAIDEIDSRIFELEEES